MALSDPELELLRELLEDDPGADVWLQVGEELLRRSEWSDAESVISAGLGVHPDTSEAWPMLARASLELGHTGLALAALENVPFDPGQDAEAARIRILALERAGRGDDARSAAEAFLKVDPNDVVVTSALERIEGGGGASTEATPARAPDPFVSMARAERYVAVGRADRAVRVLHRILFHCPEHHEAQAMLRDLGEGALVPQMTEDLSEELHNPSLAPPTLDMPLPQLQAAVADDEDTEPRAIPKAIQDFMRGTGESALPTSFIDEDDELTDPFAPVGDLEGKLSTKARAPRRRRRRRSLLNR